MGCYVRPFFQLTFDWFIPNKQENLIAVFGIGFILCHVMNGIVQYIRVHLILKLEKKFDMELTFKSYSHIMELPMDFFALRLTGEIISRLNDASKIRDALSGITISAAVDTIMAIFCGVILWRYNQELFLVAVVTLFAYGLSNVFFVKKIWKKNKEVLEHGAEVNSMFIETIKGIETIKSCGAEKKVEDNSGSIFTGLLNSHIACQSVQNLLGCITSVICGVGYAAVIWIGAQKVMQGSMTVGALLTFYSLVGYFLSPIQRIMDLQVQLQGAIVAMERLEQLLDSEKEDMKAGSGLREVKNIGDINVNHLSFRYGTRNLILKDSNFALE